jgi:hypothetical protein
MPSAAKRHFDDRLAECSEAIALYKYLDKSGYKAEFGLRFVWIATVSALDHYITELVIEKTTATFSSGSAQTPRTLAEKFSVNRTLQITNANPVSAVVAFHAGISEAVRFRSFQDADAVADGLAFFWTEPHKWAALAPVLGMDVKSAKAKLNAIAARRHLIAHNGDMDSTTNRRLKAELSDAEEVVRFMSSLVDAIEQLAI